jgi:glycosyltransferase involved in cell wall biosynthesis
MNDLGKADSILAISDSARNDLIEHFLENKNTDSSQITKVWTVQLPSLFIGEASINHGDLEFDSNRDQKVRVLCVGTLEARKNYVNLIKAFESVVKNLPADRIELIIVGKGVDRKIVDYVEEASRRLPIKWFGHVSDESLKTYYTFCDFTVFPSLGEGFGLPLTESLAFGKPVLCGTGGALQDNAALGGCLVVNVRDSEEIAAGIFQLATDPELLGRLKVEISNRKFMSWGDYATNALGITLRTLRKHV